MFNQITQSFTVMPSDAPVSSHDDGHKILQSDSIEYLKGVARGLTIAVYCKPPLYEIETLSKAALVKVWVNEKIKIG